MNMESMCQSRLMVSFLGTNGISRLLSITRGICYSLKETKIYSLNHEERDHMNPLPFLMCYGRMTDPDTWLGDIIGVADEIPNGYTLHGEICIDL